MNFEILTENSPCSYQHTGTEGRRYYGNGHSSFCLHTVIIKMNSTTLKLKQQKEVLYNGDEVTTIPVKLENGVVINTASSVWMTGNDHKLLIYSFITNFALSIFSK